MLRFSVLNQKLKSDVSHFLSFHNELHGNIPISSIHHRMMMMSTEIAHTFHYTAIFIRPYVDVHDSSVHFVRSDIISTVIKHL